MRCRMRSSKLPRVITNRRTHSSARLISVRSIKAILIVAGLVLTSCSAGSAARPPAAQDFDALAARAVRDANPQARWRAILMLAETGDLPRVVAALRPALKDPNAAIRWNAAI